MALTIGSTPTIDRHGLTGLPGQTGCVEYVAKEAGPRKDEEKYESFMVQRMTFKRYKSKNFNVFLCYFTTIDNKSSKASSAPDMHESGPVSLERRAAVNAMSEVNFKAKRHLLLSTSDRVVSADLPRPSLNP